MSLHNIYQERATQFQAQAEALEAKYNRFSFIRLLLFVIGGGIAIFLWTGVSILAAMLFIALFLIAFSRFVFWHQAIQRDQIHKQHLYQINQEEIAVLAHDYQAFEHGNEFMNPDHPYSVDLDIFGPYSFFQYSNRTSTAIGKHRLASYFTPALAPIDTKVVAPQTATEQKETILRRQGAIRELREKLDWRQNLQASGRETEDALVHVKALETWLQQAPAIKGNPLLTTALYVVPIIVLIGVALWATYLSWHWMLLFFAPSVYCLKKTFDYINKTTHQTEQAAGILAYYGELIQHIETEEFEHPYLQKLKTAFFVQNKTASQQIKRLSYRIAQLNVRNNVFAIFLNLFGIWDLQWTYQLEKWKATHQEHLPAWFESLAEIEALLSLATVYYNNPDWIMPTISDNATVVAKEMGHPLLHRDKRVSNDINIPTQGHIKLVTGSNMAGKSTLLRTVGLNVVLATVGAPVCAKQFETPILQVYTSMRTQDALHESTSSFYAELKRLKFIIEAVDTQTNIFFLLDEILKGTNSNDRHTGSKALIKQLIKSKGSGIIATHDLELGALEASYGGAIENLCMEVAVEKDTLHFDYTIKKGVSQSFNATLLMKNMGIRIED